jgi:hypothetical protein
MQAQFTVQYFASLVTCSAEVCKPHELIVAAYVEIFGFVFPSFETHFSHIILSLAEKAGKGCKVTMCRYS